MFPLCLCWDVVIFGLFKTWPVIKAQEWDRKWSRHPFCSFSLITSHQHILFFFPKRRAEKSPSFNVRYCPLWCAAVSICILYWFQPLICLCTVYISQMEADVWAEAALVSQKRWTSLARSAVRIYQQRFSMFCSGTLGCERFRGTTWAFGFQDRAAGFSAQGSVWSQMENAEPNAAVPLSIRTLASTVNVEEQAQNQTNLNSVVQTSDLTQIEFRIQQLQGRHLLLQKTLSCTKKEEEKRGASGAERKSPPSDTFRQQHWVK